MYAKKQVLHIWQSCHALHYSKVAWKSIITIWQTAPTPSIITISHWHWTTNNLTKTTIITTRNPHLWCLIVPIPYSAAKHQPQTRCSHVSHGTPRHGDVISWRCADSLLWRWRWILSTTSIKCWSARKRGVEHIQLDNIIVDPTWSILRSSIVVQQEAVLDSWFSLTIISINDDRFVGIKRVKIWFIVLLNTNAIN